MNKQQWQSGEEEYRQEIEEQAEREDAVAQEEGDYSGPEWMPMTREQIEEYMQRLLSGGVGRSSDAMGTGWT
jgi:hypothetical protein